MLTNHRKVVLCALVLALIPAASFAAQGLLDPHSQPKFVNPLPIAARVDATAGGSFNVQMGETSQWLGLVGPSGKHLMTRVWGYGLTSPGPGTGMSSSEGDLVAPFRGAPRNVPVSYPGPTFVTMRDAPVDVTWMNNLPNRHLLPIDTTIHWANPATNGVPVVTHVHGGHTESASDGLPESWFTRGFAEVGPTFVKQTYHYDNDQEAATLWYHDHALGITRLNVYAGLAGFYLLRDANELALTTGGVLPSGPYEIEIAVQDRSFTNNGQLNYFAEDEELPAAPRPTVLPEFFGDFILVNSMAWPVLDVEPRHYRLRYLNGSDSRFFVFEFRDAMNVAHPFLQIGTDGGLLSQPVSLTQLVLGPGERADLVLDFSGLAAGSEIVLRNFGPDDPFKGFPVDPEDMADPTTTGQIMKFRVSLPLSPVPDATVNALTVLQPPIAPLVQTGATRQLILLETEDEYTRILPMLGTAADGMAAFMDPITENPMVNDVEVWEIFNTTEDAHPIHLHLVQFQVLDRQAFTADQDPMTAALSNIQLVGAPELPAANEMGFKDTVQMFPGTRTRVIAKFDREGLYVWHCHILSHEDHDMMRRYYVGPMPGMVTASAARLGQNVPNPFNPATRIQFTLAQPGNVRIAIFDAAGRLVRTLADEPFGAGEHALVWDGRRNGGQKASSGVYFYRLSADNRVLTKRMVMLK